MAYPILSGDSNSTLLYFRVVRDKVHFHRGFEKTHPPGGYRGAENGTPVLRGAPPNARVAAANTLLDRAYGKAPTFSTSDTQAFKRAIDMTDDELAAVVAKARRP